MSDDIQLADALAEIPGAASLLTYDDALFGYGGLSLQDALRGLSRAANNWYSLNDPKWGAKADALYHLPGGSTTAGSKRFIRSSGSFTPADVGKLIMVMQAGAVFPGQYNRDLVTSIAAYVSPTAVDLVAPAVASVSNAEWGYGTDNTASLLAIFADIGTSGTGTVYVPPGNWGFTTFKVTVQGVALYGSPMGQLISAQNTGANTSAVWLIGDEVTIDGISLDFFTSIDKDLGNFIRGANDHSLRVGDTHWSGAYRNRCQVTRCKVYNSRNTGIDAQGYRTALIEGNEIDTLLGNGIFIGNIQKGLRITRNRMRFTGDDAIFVYTGDGNHDLISGFTIADNTIEGSYAKGIGIAGAANGTVTGNKISNTWASGIYLLDHLDTGVTLSVTNLIIANNVIDKAGQYFGPGMFKTAALGSACAIDMASAAITQIAVTSNTITSPNRYGVRVRNGADMMVADNRVFDTTTAGIIVGDVSATLTSDDVVGVVVTRNQLTRTVGGIVIGLARRALVADNVIAAWNQASSGSAAVLYGPLNDSEIRGNRFHSSGGGYGLLQRAGSTCSQVTSAPGNTLVDAAGSGPSGSMAYFGSYPVDFGPGPPTSGTYPVGAFRRNSNPSPGSPEGWVCIVAGSPGTWMQVGQVGAITAIVYGAVLQRTKAGHFITVQGVQPSTATMLNNRVFLFPLSLNASATITQLSLRVSTAASAGAVIRLAVYQEDGTLNPGQLIVEAGTVAADSVGLKTFALNQDMAPGMFWVAAVLQGATGSAIVTGIAGYAVGLDQSNNDPSNGSAALYGDNLTGAFPATAPQGLGSISPAPRILVGI